MPLIHLWTYRENRRNYPGYHLSSDAAGCALLSTVFAAISEATERRVEKVALKPVTPEALAVPNNRAGNASVFSFTHWVIDADPSFDNEYLHFEERDLECYMFVSPYQAARVRAGVDDIARGRGDYSIGAGHDALCFWWQVTPKPLQRTLSGVASRRRSGR